MLDRIVDAAALIFIAAGYRNARMEMVAERAEVAVGTLYRYAANKEALFELVLRRAFHDPEVGDVELPFQPTESQGYVEHIWRRLTDVSPFIVLRNAARTKRPLDPEEEFRHVVEELYDWQSRYWRALKIIERCARDWPELAHLFYHQFRRELFDLGATYLEKRMRDGWLRAYPDTGVAVRLIGENVAFFAMHRHTAPDSVMEDGVARETVVSVLLNAFVAPERVPNNQGRKRRSGVER
jgi:AcrR family transcriptional regulator